VDPGPSRRDSFPFPPHVPLAVPRDADGALQIGSPQTQAQRAPGPGLSESFL
jgi:hypothetical protein